MTTGTKDRPARRLKALIDRYHWLTELPDPTAALQSIADTKVLQHCSYQNA
jgi:hypothetical protein